MKLLTLNESQLVSGGSLTLAAQATICASIGTTLGVLARGSYITQQAYSPLQLLGYATVSAATSFATYQALDYLFPGRHK